MISIYNVDTLVTVCDGYKYKVEHSDNNEVTLLCDHGGRFNVTIEDIYERLHNKQLLAICKDSGTIHYEY